MSDDTPAEVPQEQAIPAKPRKKRRGAALPPRVSPLVSHFERLPPASQRVLNLMKQRSLMHSQLADHLGLSRSSVARGWYSHIWIRRNLPQIAEWLSVPVAELVGDDVSLMPITAREAAERESQLQHGAMLVVLAPESRGVYGQGEFAVVGPPALSVEQGACVAFQTEGGWMVRYYSLDHGGRFVVLLHRDPHIAPVVHAKNKCAPLHPVLLIGGRPATGGP